MMAIISKLTPLNRVFCSPDYDRAVEYLKGLLPFKVHEFPAASEQNGWIIPPRWAVKEAIIKKDGEVIYDGTSHALRVIALSTNFRGKMSREELCTHLHYDHRYDDAIPYHFRQEYRSWERDWGFCVPKRFYDSLEKGDYEVIIETEESDGALKVLEYTHRGILDQTIIFAAHLDHPGMANDGLSGCAVGTELMRRMRGRKTKFSYRLVLHQEIIGAEYYLAAIENTAKYKCDGLFLEMLGTPTQLALQASREGGSNIEYAVERAMAEMGVSFRTGPFGTIIVNGDYIWETYNIPLASLSRYPYPEYHTNRDNAGIIQEEAMNEALAILLKAVDILEENPIIIKKFAGNICVSNPRYNLYIDPGQAAFGGFIEEEAVKKMRSLMDLIPMLHSPMSIHRLAEMVELPEDAVVGYLQKWAEKGLVEIL